MPMCAWWRTLTLLYSCAHLKSGSLQSTYWRGGWEISCACASTEVLRSSCLCIKSKPIFSAPPTTCLSSQLQSVIHLLPAPFTDMWAGADTQGWLSSTQTLKNKLPTNCSWFTEACRIQFSLSACVCFTLRTVTISWWRFDIPLIQYLKKCDIICLQKIALPLLFPLCQSHYFPVSQVPRSIMPYQSWWL